jgi:hypothetical protein
MTEKYFAATPYLCHDKILAVHVNMESSIEHFIIASIIIMSKLKDFEDIHDLAYNTQLKTNDRGPLPVTDPPHIHMHKIRLRIISHSTHLQVYCSAMDGLQVMAREAYINGLPFNMQTVARNSLA